MKIGKISLIALAIVGVGVFATEAMSQRKAASGKTSSARSGGTSRGGASSARSGGTGRSAPSTARRGGGDGGRSGARSGGTGREGRGGGGAAGTVGVATFNAAGAEKDLQSIKNSVDSITKLYERALADLNKVEEIFCKTDKITREPIMLTDALLKDAGENARLYELTGCAANLKNSDAATELARDVGELRALLYGTTSSGCKMQSETQSCNDTDPECGSNGTKSVRVPKCDSHRTLGISDFAISAEVEFARANMAIAMAEIYSSVSAQAGAASAAEVASIVARDATKKLKAADIPPQEVSVKLDARAPAGQKAARILKTVDDVERNVKTRQNRVTNAWVKDDELLASLNTQVDSLKKESQAINSKILESFTGTAADIGKKAEDRAVEASFAVSTLAEGIKDDEKAVRELADSADTLAAIIVGKSEALADLFMDDKKDLIAANKSALSKQQEALNKDIAALNAAEDKLKSAQAEADARRAAEMLELEEKLREQISEEETKHAAAISELNQKMAEKEDRVTAARKAEGAEKIQAMCMEANSFISRSFAESCVDSDGTYAMSRWKVEEVHPVDNPQSPTWTVPPGIYRMDRFVDGENWSSKVFAIDSNTRVFPVQSRIEAAAGIDSLSHYYLPLAKGANNNTPGVTSETVGMVDGERVTGLVIYKYDTNQ